MARENADPVLRLARRSDAPELARLSAQLGFPITPEVAAGRLREVLGTPDHALVVAESGGRVAGWIELRRIRQFSAWRQVEILAVVVDEPERGRGIGGRLLEEAERWAADLRCGKIRVRSNQIRERTHALYRRSGFEEVSTGILFEKQLGPPRPKAAKFVPTSIACRGAEGSPRSIVRIDVVQWLRRLLRG